VHKDKYVTYLTNRVPLIDDDGNVFGICGVGFDITRPKEMEEALRVTDKTRQEKGCLSCRLSQDIDNENVIAIEETWERRSYLDEHLRSDIFSALFGAVKLLGETHEFRISEGSQIKGVEAVEAARSKIGDNRQ
jgi:quinol monooxygenase YgiN